MSAAGGTSPARLAVDIGGTFTDIVIEHGDTLTSAKLPTTPAAPERGFLDGTRIALERAGLAPRDIGAVIHGTTLATNALIERKGARTALVTTAGFRDSLEIAYETRYDQFDLFLEKTAALVPRDLRFTVPERLDARGEVLLALDEDAVRELAPVLVAAGVQALVVGFLHSYANLAHERRAADILGPLLPGVAITLSGEVCPEIREYERLSTATANAYVQPLMGRYLAALQRELAAMGVACPFYMVTSAGGMTSFDSAIRFPIRLVESGPSGGAMLARVVAEQCGERRVVSYDMGGTTAKICLVEDYTPMTARDFEVARTARLAKGSGLPLRIPVVEMIEIGAGGGSLAQVDALGRLGVGPDSAGAEPGPACYGRGGTRPAVTDADLLLGRLDGERFAEGRMRLDETAARDAVARDVGAIMKLDATQAAHGIAEIVDENMANAARIHAVEHGKSISDWTMVAFGGAGPLHAARLAQKLGMRRLLVPVNPGVGSAVGFLWAPVRFELVRSLYMPLARFDARAVNTLFAALAAEALAIVGPAAGTQPVALRRGALMRYVGQGHEVEVDIDDGELDERTAARLRERYETRYRALYGRAMPGNEIEVLTWSLVMSTPQRPVVAAARTASGALAKPSGRRAVFDAATESMQEAAVHWRPDLAPGMRFDGPALVAEPQTTTVVPGGFSVLVDEAGNLVIERDVTAPETSS